MSPKARIKKKKQKQTNKKEKQSKVKRNSKAAAQTRSILFLCFFFFAFLLLSKCNAFILIYFGLETQQKMPKQLSFVYIRRRPLESPQSNTLPLFTDTHHNTILSQGSQTLCKYAAHVYWLQLTWPRRGCESERHNVWQLKRNEIETQTKWNGSQYGENGGVMAGDGAMGG